MARATPNNAERIANIRFIDHLNTAFRKILVACRPLPFSLGFNLHSLSTGLLMLLETSARRAHANLAARLG